MIRKSQLLLRKLYLSTCKSVYASIKYIFSPLNAESGFILQHQFDSPIHIQWIRTWINLNGHWLSLLPRWTWQLDIKNWPIYCRFTLFLYNLFLVGRGGWRLYLYTRSKMHQCISAKCTKCIKMHQVTTGQMNRVMFSKRILDGTAVFGV